MTLIPAVLGALSQCIAVATGHLVRIDLHSSAVVLGGDSTATLRRAHDHDVGGRPQRLGTDGRKRARERGTTSSTGHDDCDGERPLAHASPHPVRSARTQLPFR